jgi:ABC-type sugar transport system substrate-binding protein
MVCLAAALCFGVVSCNRAKSQADTSGKRVIKIAYAFSNIDENNNRALIAMRSAVAAINEKRSDIRVELLYTDSQLNVEKQIADVESLIQQKPDLINISAVDTVGCIPAARAVRDAGILVAEDRGMEDESIDFHFLGMDEYSIQAIIKEWLVAWLNEHPNEVLKIGLIYGNPSQTLQMIRHDAIKELAVEMPGRVQILDERYGNWSTQEAMAICEDWLQRYPEMNYMAAASDDMALGAANALAAVNRLDDFLITGIDGTSIGVELVETGRIEMTVKALMTKIYAIALDAYLAKIEGTLSERSLTAGRDGVVAMDASNIAIYKDMD